MSKLHLHAGAGRRSHCSRRYLRITQLAAKLGITPDQARERLRGSGNITRTKRKSVITTQQAGRAKLNPFTPVGALGLNNNAVAALRRADLHTLGDIIGCTAADLLDLRGFGQGSLDMLKGVLATADLYLKGEQAKANAA